LSELDELTVSYFLWQLALITLILVINAFFVITELAFQRLKSTKIQDIISNKNEDSEKFELILENLERAISSNKLGTTFSTIALGFVAYRFIEDLSILIIFKYNIDDSSTLILLISITSILLWFLLVSGLYIVIGDLIPRSLVIYNAEKVVTLFTYPLYYFVKLTNPLLNLFSICGKIVLKAFRIPVATDAHTQVFTEEEIKNIIDDSIKTGELEEFESSLIYNILDFTDTPAKSIITPRFKVVAVSTDVTINEIIHKSKETGFSRFPVYEQKLDNIKGFIHIKDVIASINGHGDNFDLDKPFEVEKHLRKVITVHEGKPIDDLLKEMQFNQIQVAVLVDEWGSFEGIVTIEDIVEAIVGPILDEFDDTRRENWIYQSSKDPNKYLVAAQVPIDQFNDTFDNDTELQIEAKDSVTLAGYLLEKLESKIPTKGEIIVNNRITFKILEVNGNRIDKVEIQIHPKPEPIDKDTKDNREEKDNKNEN
jgi:CBS domain containing-hemolysin-like protein